MKLAIRILAIAVVAAAAVAGNTLPKPQTVAASHQASVPGPTPTCNPFISKCSTIR